MNPEDVPATLVEKVLETRLPSGGLPSLNEPQVRTILAAVLPEYAATVLEEFHENYDFFFNARGEPVSAVASSDFTAEIARLTDTSEETAPTHVGGWVNAEDCPACSAALDPPPYPWICPGPNENKEPTDD